MSTGEISEEAFNTGSLSEEVSTDDESTDEWSPPNAGSSESPRVNTPLQPTH
jgi:hypothetical protein